MQNDILGQVKIPAIGLLIVGSLNGVFGLLALFSGLLRLVGATKETVPSDQAERLGYFIGTGFSYGIAIFSLVLAPVIIYGAAKMLKGEKIGIAKTAAVLAILPFSSCCFIFGVPLGIWALIVLRKPEVKAFFENRN